MRILLPILLAAALAPNLARAQADGLPLKRVVMFSSGVAFYEHNGQIDGDASVDLKFNVDDVNDLLKSMVLQDLGGGRISTITYGSRDPITKTLRTFAIDLTSNPTLAQLLAQVRGEQIELAAPGKITGVIVGIETKQKRMGKDEVVQVEVMNLLTDAGLRSIPLDDVQSIKLLNAKLDAELRQALTVLALGHATDKKTVTLNFLGRGQRNVHVGYIQESPIWKTSYRLVLKDDEQPYLQGWAIVENTTEMDWQDVALTLISGRPISFRMDLYRPLYVDRPLVEPELYASLRPQVYDQDLEEAEEEFKQLAGNANRGRSAGDNKLAEKQRSLASRFAAPTPQPSNDPASFDPQTPSVAQAGDVGELFQYAIENPVSLPRQQSAMLPIVNESVKGEKVSIYNQSVQAKHPLNGLQLTNTSGLHLMQGPITVFDGGVYAGDAKINDLSPGTTRLISYALDLDTEVAPETQPSPQVLTAVKVVKGTLYATTKYRRGTNYTIKNSGRRAKKVLIEYPHDSAWKLIETDDPAETTRDLYRFAVAAKPGVPAKFKVREERTATQNVVLSNNNDNTIRIYIRSPVVSDAIKEALAEVIKRRQAISEVVADRQRLEGQIKVIDQEQNRIRQNMAQLSRSGDLYARYVKKFGEQEDQVETLREQIAGQVKREADLKKQLDAYLVGLTVG